jgi:UDP-3-O-[3-hydroxymyristoyl] N-acetylglucosamine deacetylase/3-hydroxyacyl-[acyl-carrier-protein] dehydratase
LLRHQRTLKNPVEYTGVGLHTGEEVTVRFLPAEPNVGLRFRVRQGDEWVEIPATIDSVPDDQPFHRNTTLRAGGVQIHTVEHVLAALFGLSIDNAWIELDASEPPEPEDGSCQAFVDRILKVGIAEQGVPAVYYEVQRPVQWSQGKIGITAIPYDGFRLSFTIQYDNEVIGTQYASYDIDPDVFAREIAPSRTFALKREINHLQAMGLIKGGTLRNALVVDENKILNEEGLRFPDEFVRHKILDLLGDLALLGMPIKGHVISLKSGHETNVKFVRRLASLEKGRTRIYGQPKPTFWDITAVMDLLPHRYPFLLIDRILEVEPGKRARGLKNVSINEPFFQGHFPGHPIMPGVLIIEAMAQVGGVLLLSMIEQPETKLVYFSSIDKARFRRPVLPGDQLMIEVELLRFKRNTCKMSGIATVDGEKVAEGEMLAAVVNR